MRRRDLIKMTTSTSAPWPLAAQQPTMLVNAHSGTGSRECDASRLPSFYQALSEGG